MLMLTHTHSWISLLVKFWNNANIVKIFIQNFHIDNFIFMLKFVHLPPPPSVPKVFGKTIAQYILHESDCE